MHATHRPDVFVEASDEVLGRYLGDCLGRDDPLALVASHDERVVGCQLAEHVQRSATPFRRPSHILFVYQLAVDPACRRAGAGTRLMGCLQAEAARRGCSAVKLNSAAFDRDAHLFFEKQGFHPSDTT